MKGLQPVAWTKGTFLSPQHLQAQDSYFESVLRFRLDSLGAQPWGFTEFGIDHGQLERGVLQIARAAGLFPDGTSFDFPESDGAPGARSLADCFGSGEEAVDFTVAVPAWRESDINVAPAGARSVTRYRVDVREVSDDNTGGTEKLIQFARKNLLLLTALEAEKGYAAVPVARVRKTGAAKWSLDPEFIPPAVRVGASLHLQSIASQLADLLLARSDSLSLTKRQKNTSLAAFSSTDVARFWLLYTVNSHYAGIRHMAGVSHPADLFAEMLSLAGALTAFSRDTRPGDLPSYNHGAPAEPFNKLNWIIRHLLDTVIPSNAISLPLRLKQPFVYSAALDTARHLPQGVAAYLGIRSSAKPQDLISRAPGVVKIASTAEIELLYKQAIGGVQLREAGDLDAIPVKTEFHYFQLSTTGTDWESIRRTGSIAVYVPGDFPDPALELVLILPDRE